MNGNNNAQNITIFGGTGDLAYRKLLPALYNLFARNIINENDKVIAIGRREYTNEEYVTIVKKWVSDFSRIKFDESIFDRFSKCILYFKMDFSNLSEYKKLCSFFSSANIRSNIFYYAVAPQFFDIISDGILSLECRGESKIVVEKPFGETLKEADILSKKLDETFGQDNVYRIDHYLGKEMLRSIQTIRFKNPIFRNCWDAKSIENVLISASEEVGVETRAGYYDKAGALKDMVQNHLMQILSLISMEECENDSDIKIMQVQALRSLREIAKINIKESLVLAQYSGYLNEDNISKDSKTETYALCKIYIDNQRWKGVPFYITTGKKLNKREMEIIITFKSHSSEKGSNILTFKIQPDEGINLKFNIKKPGESDDIIQAEMDFCQSCVLAHRINTPEAYERLLYAVIQSDTSLFSTWEQIHLSWKYIEDLKKMYSEASLPIHTYEQGSSGPSEAIKMIKG